MRIAMFSDSYFPRVNGVAVSIKCFSEALVRNGHEVCIVCPSYEDKGSLSGSVDVRHESGGMDNLTIIRISASNIVFSREDRYVRVLKWRLIKKEMDAFRPDVIHVNTEFTLGMLGMTYARHRMKALVYTNHTMWEKYIENYVHFLPSAYSKRIGKEFVRFFAKRAQAVIVPTEKMKALLLTYGIDSPMCVLPTGIDDSPSRIDDARVPEFLSDLYSSFPVLKDRPILLYVGRVVKEKNLDMLFGVLAEVKKSVPDAVLLFVGGGPELEPLKERAGESEFASSICFAGYRERSELAYFYNIAKVFVFPSCSETQGLVTIEAMRASLPVVAVGEMGTVDVMCGDNGGYMVRNDVHEFASRVVDLLTDEQLHGKKRREAEEWSRKWSMDYLLPKLESCYRMALEERSANR